MLDDFQYEHYKQNKWKIKKVLDKYKQNSCNEISNTFNI